MKAKRIACSKFKILYVMREAPSTGLSRLLSGRIRTCKNVHLILTQVFTKEHCTCIGRQRVLHKSRKDRKVVR